MQRPEDGGGAAVALVKHKLDLQSIELDLQFNDAPPVMCDAGRSSRRR